MPRKKLSLKGLADFMTATSTRQRRILHNYKYPTEDEARAKILYYRDARDRIAAYHKSSHDVAWLVDQAHNLFALSASSSRGRKARLENNARGIRQYTKYFARRNFELLEGFSYDIRFADIYISVYTDLHVIERGTEKIIKLEFARNEPDDKVVKIICQCMFEAAQRSGLNLPSSSVLLFDIPRGESHRGARMGSRVTSEIESTCENISAIWDAI